jgi:gamma-glutamyltranspeptidase/glutathione hydrolase
LRIEGLGVSKRGLKALRAMGHEVRTIGRQGDAHSILVDPETGIYIGAADKRSNGSAVGY